MARKYYVDLSDTIAAWRSKTNLISGNIGDLDNLKWEADSDVVEALNSLYDLVGNVTNQNRDVRLLIKDANGNIVKTIFGYSDSGVL